ncbi:MAG: SgcJ/EcaC family oxidoreductase [Nitrospirae bacterium]|nr:SgcJ/EcaC family oxidoreductase [Nitrospirota bacterium]
MEEFARLFAEDAEFVNVVGLWWKGREQIKRAHEATHASMFKNSRLTIANIAVRFVKSDVAIARSSWELTGHVGPSGEVLPMRKGILMNLVVRKDDNWEIIDSQNTDIIEGVLAPPQQQS